MDEITVEDLNEAIAALSEAGRKPATIRKSIQTLATLLSDSGVEPNVVRDRRLRFPHERRGEIKPPTGEHVGAAHALLPARYRLPLLVLDATGMRVGELESLTWGDVDEPRSRWRVSQAASKTRRAGWVQVPPAVFDAVLELVPRDDRTAERPVFQGFGADRFRTALMRACRATGVPSFSPHDLRHRRISLLHLAGVPLGANRRARRTAKPRRHGERLQPRPRRRGRARLRESARLSACVSAWCVPWCVPRRAELAICRGVRVLPPPLRAIGPSSPRCS